MRKLLLFVIVAVVTGAAMAAPVDGEKAARTAHIFWQQTLQGPKGAQLRPVAVGCDAVHLFVAPEGGWVMVSADDAARPILAYSTTSHINPDRLPAAMADFLYVYQQEIAAASSAKLPRHAEWDLLEAGCGMKAATEEEAVGPLLTTTWFQTAPYNQLCPSGCMTGCEATAIAQVLKFWNYPAFGQGQHSYNDANGHGVQSADFANTRYDWANMPNRLSSSSTAAQKTAVATLMYHCGVAVNMSYSPTYSGAVMSSVIPALTTYFRYSPRARFKAKGTMSNEAWTDTLIAELRHHRPIVYGGEGAAGGHVFVCDGFDARRYLHFNLGEDGEGDGYYQIGAITYGMYSFNSANDCVMGIEPQYGIYCNTEQLDYARQASSQQVWVSTSDTSTATWTASSNEDWIEISGCDFAHLGQMTVRTADNNTGAERSGTVTLRQGGLSATVAVVQAAYDPATDYCPLTVEMGSSRNEPWASDAHLTFESPSGLVYGRAQHTANSGSSSTQVRVAPHDVMVRWHSGDGRDRYANYKIKNQYGETLVEVSNAFLEGGDQLLVWPCAHLAIEDMGTATVTVSPNPTTGFLHIEAAGTQRVELYDLQGRLVKTGTEDHLDLTDMPKGIYFLRVVTAMGTAQKKVAKQ